MSRTRSLSPRFNRQGGSFITRSVTARFLSGVKPFVLSISPVPPFPCPCFSHLSPPPFCPSHSRRPNPRRSERRIWSSPDLLCCSSTVTLNSFLFLFFTQIIQRILTRDLVFQRVKNPNLITGGVTVRHVSKYTGYDTIQGRYFII